MTRATFIFASLLIFGACEDAGRDAAVDRAAIDSLRAEHVLAVNSRDAEFLLSGMADDVVYLGPDLAPVIGASELEPLLRETYEQLSPDITMSEREVQIRGNWAVEWGCLGGVVNLVEGGEPMPNDGKYLFVYEWRPETGWKLTHDIYNMGPCGGE